MSVLRGCLLVLSTVLAAVPVCAQEFAGSGERLAMLKKIQGSWQRECQKAVVNTQVVYEQTRLFVDFTRLVFTTTEYSNRECFLKEREYRTIYQYTVGDGVDIGQGEQAYELDLVAPGTPVGVIRLALLSLIQFNDGYLYFGQRRAGDAPTTRAIALDRDNPFQRR